MTAGVLVDCFFYEVGKGDFLHSFFSTISHHLEREGWGSTYPYLLKDLYHDTLRWTDAAKARAEAQDIESKLSLLKADQIVWDIEDLSKLPPWGDVINPQVTNLANYFATPEGHTFFEVLYKALEVAIEERADVTIRSI